MKLVLLQEQFFIMKPNENIIRSFKLYPTTDQAAKYVCSGEIKCYVCMPLLDASWIDKHWCQRVLNFSKKICLNAAILKDSDYSEVDRAECQFTTTATVFDNGSQVWW